MEGGMQGPVGTRSAAVLGQRFSDGTATTLDQVRLTILALSDEPSFVGFLLFFVAASAVAIDRLGARLMRPSYNDIYPGTSPDVLYLRNFGDDRMKLRAGRITRRGILGRLSPFRMRPFEELVVSRLAGVGPTLGVNPPGVALERLGVLKEKLPSEEGAWKQRIADMADQALVVAISATPRSINDGLAALRHEAW
jgi:hypothetical protein